MSCRFKALLQKIYDELTADHGCTCGGVDNGVGIQHEPHCGEPNTEALARTIKEELESKAPCRPIPPAIQEMLANQKKLSDIDPDAAKLLHENREDLYTSIDATGVDSNAGKGKAATEELKPALVAGIDWGVKDPKSVVMMLHNGKLVEMAAYELCPVCESYTNLPRTWTGSCPRCGKESRSVS
jgi:hypothetical protein